VVFRSLNVVEKFANPKEHDWQSFIMHPSSWPIPEDCKNPDLLQGPISGADKEGIEQRAAIYNQMNQNAAARLRTFQDALIRGRVVASGRLNTQSP